MAHQRTRTEAVYERLRDDILSGRLPPGSRLRFTDLAERYGASMGVTREALSRLSEQGLVTSEPQLGFRVIPLSAVDLLDLTEARCQVEGLALAQSVENGTLDWESNLLAAHHALARTPQRASGESTLLSQSWTLAHERFHAALIRDCPNSRLKALASSLRANAEVYRHWSTGFGERDTQGEHQRLCDAALDRDVPQALTCLLEHLIETARLLLKAAPDASGTSLTRLEEIPTFLSTGAQLFAQRTNAIGHLGR